jgi:hypothetical protein
VVFPAVVRYFSSRNPILDIPDPNIAAGGELGSKIVTEKEDQANRTRKLIDHNFHKVQVNYCVDALSYPFYISLIHSFILPTSSFI